MIVGQLPVLPKHFWEGTGATASRAISSKSTLEIPLGSGPYRIKEVDAGRTDHLRARQGLVGEGPARRQGPMELRRDQASSTSATACRRSRPSRPASSTTGRSRARRPGPRGSISTPSSAARSRWTAPDRQRRADAGVRLQHPPSAVPGPARAAAPSTWRSTSSGPTRTCSTTSTSGSAATSRTPS